MSSECLIKQEPSSPTPGNDYKSEPANSVPLFVSVKQEAIVDQPDVRVKVEPPEEIFLPAPSCIVGTGTAEHVSNEKDSTAAWVQQPPKITVKIEKVEAVEHLEVEVNPADAQWDVNEDKNSAIEETAHCGSEGFKYSCSICNKAYSRKSNLHRHCDTHAKQQFQCEVCLKKFNTPKLLTSHMKSHRQKVYQCKYCEKSFMTTSNLSQHQRVHVKPFSCDVCGRTFAVKAAYIRHVENKLCKLPTDKLLTCDICGKGFKRDILLRSHLRRHTPEKPYTCDICKMNFKHKSTLVRHIQMHSDYKPYACNICGKQFTHVGMMRPHMRMHTGEKPFQCQVCWKSFAYKYNMERHAVRHEKEKNLTCNICNKKFPKESRLKYHITMHTTVKHFACFVCPKKFSHKQNIVRHYKRKHPNEKYETNDTDASVALKVWDEVVNKKIRVLDKLPEETVSLPKSIPITMAKKIEVGKEEESEYIVPDSMVQQMKDPVVTIKVEKMDSEENSFQD